MIELKGQNAKLFLQIVGIIWMILVRSVVLAPLVIVVSLHLFIIVVFLISLLSTAHADWLMDLLPQLFPILRSNAEYSLSGDVVSTWLVGSYLKLSFWFSLGISALNAVFHDNIALSPKVTWLLFVGLVLTGSLIFGSQLNEPATSRIVTGFIVGFLSFIVGGVPLIFLTLIHTGTVAE